MLFIHNRKYLLNFFGLFAETIQLVVKGVYRAAVIKYFINLIINQARG